MTAKVLEGFSGKLSEQWAATLPAIQCIAAYDPIASCLFVG